MAMQHIRLEVDDAQHLDYRLGEEDETPIIVIVVSACAVGLTTIKVFVPANHIEVQPAAELQRDDLTGEIFVPHFDPDHQAALGPGHLRMVEHDAVARDENGNLVAGSGQRLGQRPGIVGQSPRLDERKHLTCCMDNLHRITCTEVIGIKSH